MNKMREYERGREDGLDLARRIVRQVWETIRKLTCVVCGKQYVRQLANVENVDEIAEKLCQFVYDLKIGFKKQESAK